jgi:subtilase family serine protease
VPTLAAGAISSGSTLLTLPSDIAGMYRIIAVADAANVNGEINEANNVAVSSPFEIGPDLTITGTTVPANAAAGATIFISDVTKNRGGAPAPATTTRIYLSTGAVLAAGDVLLGSRAVPALAAGIFNSATTPVAIPAQTPAGSYFIIVAADAGSALSESNEANNTLAKPIDILPDLRVTVLSAPSKAFPGATITISDTTVNQGAASGPSTTAFFLSTDGALDTGDLLLGSRPVPALGLGEASTGSISVVIPAGTAGGTYTIIAVGDAGGVAAELDETNNTRTKTLTIGPDLSVSALIAPSSAAAGSTIIVSDTTRNDGSAAGPTTTRFYLSADATLGAGDVLLGSRAVPALGLSEVSTGSVALTIPSGTAAGTYYVIAQADGDAVIAELVETNNVKTRSISVTP